tara:strand:+ start:408 stop:761 length:354 start_codon:yes stop_codon:yes gene_type:complete
MNTQREVFNKLFKEEKTELATQKIELALIQDIKKRDKFIKKTLSEMDGLEADFLFTKNRIKNISNLLESDANLLDKDVSEAISKLKDLGLSSKEFSQYTKTISKAKQESKKIKSIIN